MTHVPELTEAEVAELDGFLARVDGGRIPNTEALDGFFAALACCPDFIMPSEYLPVVQRGESEEGDLVFESSEEAQRFVALVNLHWNHVIHQLSKGEVYFPLIQEDQWDECGGNDWANGFLTGTHLRHDIWSRLINDEERGGGIVPIMALAYEHDPDPEMRPFKEPVDEKKREDLIVHCAAGVMRIYAYFLPQRSGYLPETEDFLRPRQEVGRNAPCPCGSGEKYKRCCGQEPTSQ